MTDVKAGRIKSEAVTSGDLEAFEDSLHRSSLQGHWEHIRGGIAPVQRVVPHHWRWAEVSSALERAGELVSLEGDTAGRRTIRLVNPSLAATSQCSTHTLHMSVQLVKPGEVASAHRHSMAAIRFVLSGTSVVTTVDGEPLTMSPRDLILTPNWSWHDHVNAGSEPTIWLDGLDIPLVRYFGAAFFEPYGSATQPRRSRRHRAGLHRGLRPAARRGTEDAPLRYAWDDVAQCVEAGLDSELDPYDGVLLEYVGPDGGHTLPTMSCMLQALPPHYATRAHRHTSSGVFHVIEGSGTAKVGDASWHWEPGDFFVIPNWTWHSLTNDSREPSVFFVISDRPQLEVFGLYREGS